MAADDILEIDDDDDHQVVLLEDELVPAKINLESIASQEEEPVITQEDVYQIE